MTLNPMTDQRSNGPSLRLMQKGIAIAGLVVASVLPFTGTADAETEKIPFKCGDQVWMIERTEAAINAAIQRCLGAEAANEGID